MIQYYNVDCLEAMKKAPNNHWDLAIVDPPYGIHEKLLTSSPEPNRSNKFALRYMEKNWDHQRPTAEYFSELQRVSKNQIIWGGNYFADLLPPSRGWICWDKKQDKFTCVNHELAWTSFDVSLKMFRRYRNLDTGIMVREAHQMPIHPTQKPLELYIFCLEQYTKNNRAKILDTHLGSGSIGLACYDLGYTLDAFEIDKDYFDAARHRLDVYRRQLKLFAQ